MKALGGKGVLLVAVVLGVATSYLSWRYVQQASAANSVPMVPVVVAAQSIPQRTVIAPSMVQVRNIPADARPAGVYANPNDVVGKVSKSQLAPGEQLWPHQLYLQREKSGLAFMIPEAHRAVAIAVSEVIGSGGLIVPGDRVDVYALFDLKEKQETQDSTARLAEPTPSAVERLPKENTVITLMLQNVEVLAVAQLLEGQDPRSGNERLTDEVLGAEANGSSTVARARAQPQARTVTVAVLPGDAEKLILAEERGEIRLALRPAESTEQVDVAPIELRQLIQASVR